MICDAEAFLLVAQKWMAESAPVLFSISLFEGEPTPFLAVRTPARVWGIDEALPGVSLLIGEDGITVIDLRQWNLGFADKQELPANPDNVEEGFTLTKGGVLLTLWRTLED